MTDSVIKAMAIAAAVVLGGFALVMTGSAGQAARRGDLQTARGDATLAAVAVMAGVAALMLTRMLLP